MASVSHAIQAIRESRSARVGCLLALGLITSSCGDVYRPVAQIVPGTPPNPSAVHFIETVSANGKLNSGSGSRLDVAGDTNLGNLQTAVQPAHAAVDPK